MLQLQVCRRTGASSLQLSRRQACQLRVVKKSHTGPKTRKTGRMFYSSHTTAGVSFTAVLRSNTQQEQQPQTSSVADDARPGRPVEIATEATVERLEELIPADTRITIDKVATALGCSHCLAYSTMHDRLKFRKV
jgi:hypothetical protein